MILRCRIENWTTQGKEGPAQWREEILSGLELDTMWWGMGVDHLS